MLNRILNKFANNFFLFLHMGPSLDSSLFKELFFALEDHPTDGLRIWAPFGTNSHMWNLRKLYRYVSAETEMHETET